MYVFLGARPRTGPRRSLVPVCFIALFALLVGIPIVRAEEPGKHHKTKFQHGTACWHQGTNRTAIGEPWAAEEFMAAHRSFPLGSRVRVTNVKNGRSTVVRITDRGPYTRGRVIDLSRAAARDLGLLDQGLGEVRVEIVEADDAPSALLPKPSA